MELLAWSEWMQRDDWASADLADTQKEADRLNALHDIFGNHVKRATWLRAALAAEGKGEGRE
jgi:hypothetical protein